MNVDNFLKVFKNKHNRVFIIIFIIGVVLMMTAQAKPAVPKTAAEPNEQEELARILSDIEGAGSVQVMVTYYGTGSDDIVYDTKIRGEQTDRTAVVSGGEAVVSGRSFPRVKGVVVTAKGAKRAEVKSAILQAVMTALDVPEYKVSVLCGR